MMRLSRIASLCAVAACAVASMSCPNTTQPPGTVLATMSFTAVLVPDFSDGGTLCQELGYAELPETSSFQFTTVFSGELDGSVQWMTLGDQTRPATFDGQFIGAPHSAPRTFSLCRFPDAGVAPSTVVEAFDIALFSNSQEDALPPPGLTTKPCPVDPLDAGSWSLDPGVASVPPSMTPTGFDATFGCGVLLDTIQPDPATNCLPCTLRYSLRGDRL